MVALLVLLAQLVTVINIYVRWLSPCVSGSSRRVGRAGHQDVALNIAA